MKGDNYIKKKNVLFIEIILKLLVLVIKLETKASAGISASLFSPFYNETLILCVEHQIGRNEEIQNDNYNEY